MKLGEALNDEDTRLWRAFIIMREMGWSYNDYQNTPSHVIDNIWWFMQTERKALEN